MASLTLDTLVTTLPMVRGRVADGFARLGIRTIRHLLFHFPARHEDRRVITRVHDVRVGEPVVLQATVLKIASHEEFRRTRGRARRMMLTQATLADESGEIPAVWFHQRFLEKRFPAGSLVYAVGVVNMSEQKPSLVAPELERCHDGQVPVHAARLVPIYPETAGVTSRLIRFLVHRVLPLASDLREYDPQTTRVDERLLGIADAVRGIHFPESSEALEAARRRLAFDELFLLQLSARIRRRERAAQKAVPLPIPDDAVSDTIAQLPFRLTPSQTDAIRTIIADLRREEPMCRLLAGDVGSGKTVVAGLAALAVARAGWQTALIAPTEILAAQHAEALSALFDACGLHVALLTGSTATEAREALLHDVARGTAQCLVGTHALLHLERPLPRLALVIVDEQHRFGVAQRAELTQQRTVGTVPHFLSLTATPIPRTLQLTAYGDVEVSPLDPRPEQQRIQTVVVLPAQREAMYESLKDRLMAQEQVFVICPRVEEGDDELKSVLPEYDRLRREVFPTFRLGFLHGKLPAEEKQRVLDQFRNRELDLLVASSVVEVGVDIPNATALLVEGAERFGLAQLHQCRGRVGRRGQQAVCYLACTTGAAGDLERLQVLEKTRDGLALAEEDLRRRGAGEIYGTRQSGGVRLRVASLADIVFLHVVRHAAENLLTRDPALLTAPLLKKRVSQLNVTTHFE